MRDLILLRGPQGSGKSQFIRSQGLEEYTLSADRIRSMFQSPVTQVDGTRRISSKQDGKVWKFLFDLAEERMSRGELVIVDATHSRKNLITRYKKLMTKYRYRCTVVNFLKGESAPTLETCLNRNRNRSAMEFVPEDAVETCYERIRLQKTPNWCKEVAPEELEGVLSSFGKHMQFEDKFDKYVFIGDIHGCATALKETLNKCMDLEEEGVIVPYEDTFYIFVGDYFDRGIENAEVFRLIEHLSQFKNVLLLEGNHEHWIDDWGQDRDVRFPQATRRMIAQLEKASITKSEARQLYRKFAQMAYFSASTSQSDQTFLVTHGGIPTTPSAYMATEEMIKGIGEYSDSRTVDETFSKNYPYVISIHGHRNIEEEQTFNTPQTINLCGKVEFGEELRAVEFYTQCRVDPWKDISTVNTVYDEELKKQEDEKKSRVMELSGSQDEAIKQLDENKAITKKKLEEDGVYSYNFSRQVFQKGSWTDQTIKARGLFIDREQNKVVARSYDKFFNFDEREETKRRYLQQNLAYPVRAYKKENGYLGILSTHNGEWFAASKSTTSGWYAERFRELLKERGVWEKEALFKYLRDHNSTLIFEVVDPVNDPHMIQYENVRLYVLDCIENRLDKEVKLPYESLVELIYKWVGFIHVSVKTKFPTEFNSWDEVNAFIDKVEKDSYDWRDVEGYVLEDASGYRVKLKTRFYRTWKHMRTVWQKIQKGREVKLQMLFTPEHNRIYQLMVDNYTREQAEKMSILDVQKDYLKEKDND